jgi:hypothetical protein
MKLVSSMRELTSQEIDMVAGGHEVWVCILVDGKIVECKPVEHDHPTPQNVH